MAYLLWVASLKLKFMSDSFLQMVSNVFSDIDSIKLDVTIAIVSLIGIGVIILGVSFLKKALNMVSENDDDFVENEKEKDY